MYWIHKDTQTTISEDDKIILDETHNTIINGYPKYQVEQYLEGDQITFELVVNRLEPRDHGNYTCQILVRGSYDHPSKDGEMIVLGEGECTVLLETFDSERVRAVTFLQCLPPSSWRARPTQSQCTSTRT